MAYDEGLAQRVREVVANQEGVTEKKMFGGLSFMIGGNMACGVRDDAISVRVGPDNYEQALAQPHVRVFPSEKRPMRGMVYVDAPAIAADDALAEWVGKGVAFASSLPPK